LVITRKQALARTVTFYAFSQLMKVLNHSYFMQKKKLLGTLNLLEPLLPVDVEILGTHGQ
jgi:hypothetical protein